MELHHGVKTVILLDEYDVPLENAWQKGFYPEMISFIRSLFESALKTNDALEFAVVTGCLRISRESIFTGMNNLNIISIRSGNFSESFGFTEGEAMRLLEDYGLEEKAGEVRAWYDGYLFGEEGDGRPDVTLYPEDPPEPAYLFECKVRKKFNEMQDGLAEAFAQIRAKRYEEGILDEGYAGAVSYGICFCKKSCIVGLYRV